MSWLESLPPNKRAKIEIQMLREWAKQWAEHLPKLRAFIDEHGEEIDPDTHTELMEAIDRVRGLVVRDLVKVAPEAPEEPRGDRDEDGRAAG